MRSKNFQSWRLIMVMAWPYLEIIFFDGLGRPTRVASNLRPPVIHVIRSTIPDEVVFIYDHEVRYQSARVVFTHRLNQFLQPPSLVGMKPPSH